MVKKEEVIQFLENIKDFKFVKEQCKKYHESEPRDAVYMVIMRFLDTHRTKEDILLSERAFLLSWNWGYYQPRPERGCPYHFMIKAMPNSLFEALGVYFEQIWSKAEEGENS